MNGLSQADPRLRFFSEKPRQRAFLFRARRYVETIFVGRIRKNLSVLSTARAMSVFYLSKKELFSFVHTDYSLAKYCLFISLQTCHPYKLHVFKSALNLEL